MKPDLKTAVGRLRVCGKLEGISFLLLLGVAMPLKYAFAMPLAVKYTGWAHGLLFIIFMLMILMAWLERRISFGHAALAFVASLIPFGPFLIDRKLSADQDKEVASEL
jgi:integral membrane protein